MQAAPELLISGEEYLKREKNGDVRHEYIGGRVYAMAGTSEEHNILSLAIASALRTHLQGKACRAFMADVKVRLQVSNTDIFYYPDVMVVCDPSDTDRYYKRFPRVLVEVLSPDTERTDRREKFVSYTQIPTLEEYVLVAQERMEVTVFRRANNWQAEVFAQPSQVMHLPSIEFSMPLSAVYEGIKFP